MKMQRENRDLYRSRSTKRQNRRRTAKQMDLSARVFVRQVEQIPQAGPEAPLLVPVRDLSDRLQLGQTDRIASSPGERQEQNLLLDIGRQQEQVHDLGDARPAH